MADEKTKQASWKEWAKMFTVAVIAVIAVNTLTAGLRIVYRDFSQYRDFKRDQYQRYEPSPNYGDREYRPFDNRRKEAILEYVTRNLPPKATKAEIDALVKIFRTTADGIESNTFRNPMEAFSDMAKQIPLVASQEWVSFFDGLVKLFKQEGQFTLGSVASFCRRTADALEENGKGVKQEVTAPLPLPEQETPVETPLPVANEQVVEPEQTPETNKEQEQKPAQKGTCVNGRCYY